MRKITLFLMITAVFAACSGSNSNSENGKLDTTPVLSPTNNQLRTGTDTLGFRTDSLAADSDSVSVAE